MARYLLFVSVIFSLSLKADHVSKFEIAEIEWNGTLKTYNPVRKFEFRFSELSPVFFIDSIQGAPLFGRFIYVPIFSDHSERPGFVFEVFDSSDKRMNIITKTDYKQGIYDAGMKVKDQLGYRRWLGKLKYTPDTSIHLVKPVWRKDRYTLKVETFRAWNAENKKAKSENNRIIKNMYFQGYTGELTPMQSGGKYGNESFYIQVDPERYQWGSEVWLEIKVRLHRKNPDGTYYEVLAHVFPSTDSNITYSGQRKQNAYEIRDAENKYYMLLTGVLLIPY